MSSGPETKQAEIQGLSEETIKQIAEKIRDVFRFRVEDTAAHNRRSNAEVEASRVAPEGYLFRLVAKEVGALTLLHSSPKDSPWREDLEPGRAVYAPKIDANQNDGYTTSTVTSWINGPLGIDLPDYVVGRTRARINNGDFELGLVSIEELNAEHANRITLR